ncbi:MAG TPA: hypothetical protein VEA92_03840 [Candidatus Paceibacterota bacterium]|nr:hypothetical protein [Candidatus Paceibacterota bacterium]
MTTSDAVKPRLIKGFREEGPIQAQLGILVQAIVMRGFTKAYPSTGLRPNRLTSEVLRRSLEESGIHRYFPGSGLTDEEFEEGARELFGEGDLATVVMSGISQSMLEPTA